MKHLKSFSVFLLESAIFENTSSSAEWNPVSKEIDLSGGVGSVSAGIRCSKGKLESYYDKFGRFYSYSLGVSCDDSKWSEKGPMIADEINKSAADMIGGLISRPINNKSKSAVVGIIKKILTLNENLNENLNEKEFIGPEDIRVNPDDAGGIDYAYISKKSGAFSNGEKFEKGDRLWTVGDYTLNNLETGISNRNKVAEFIVATVQKVFNKYKSSHPGKNALDCVNAMTKAAIRAHDKREDPIMKHIHTFESFLNESYSVRSDKVIKELNRLLELNKRRGADTFDVFEIPNDWTVYDKVVRADRKDMMEPSQCFQNALDFSKKTGAPCILGGFINKEELISQAKWMDSGDENKFRTSFVFYPHAFNLDDKGQVYDITIYNDPGNWLYVGVEVDPSKFTSGFRELLPYLNKIIHRKI